MSFPLHFRKVCLTDPDKEHGQTLFIARSFLYQPQHLGSSARSNFASPVHGVTTPGLRSRRRAVPRGDRDYGTAGTLLIPGTRLGVCNDKNGEVYLLNLDKLGGYQARAEGIEFNTLRNCGLAFQGST